MFGDLLHIYGPMTTNGDELPVDVEHCREIITKQREDLQHLKELVVRHESIISEYQNAYPELNPHRKVDVGDGPAPPLPPWMTSPQTMVPLLAAYDRRVQLLETSLEFHKQEVTQLKQNSLELVEENETLRSDLKHYMEAAINVDEGRATSGTGINTEKGNSAMLDEFEAMQAQNQVLTETNQILTQQTAVLEAEIEQSREDMESFQSKNFELEKRAAYLEQSIKDLDRGRQGEIHATRSSFSKQFESLSQEARAEIHSLQREIGVISSEKQVLEKTLQERVAQMTQVEANYKKSEQKKSEMEQELHSLKAKYEDTAQTLTKLKNSTASKSYEDVKKIKKLEADFDDARKTASESLRRMQIAQARNNALEKELDELRQQQVSMVDCMNAYDRQLGQLTEREQSMQQIANAAKETVQDAILQRDKAKQEVKSLQIELSELDKVLETTRADSITHSVEVQSKADAEARAKIDSYRDEMDSIRARNARLEQMHERLQREKSSAVSEADRIKTALNEARSQFLKNTDDLVSRCLAAEHSHSDATRATEQLKHELTSERDRSHKMRQNFTRDLETLHQKSEASERKCVALSEQIRRLKHELLASKTEGTRLVTELQNTQDELNDKFARLRQEYSDFQANAEKQVQELQMESERAKRYAQHIAQEGAAASAEQAQSMESNIGKLKKMLDAKTSRIADLEKIVRQIRAERHELQRSKQDDQQLIKASEEHNAQTMLALDSAKAAVLQRQQQLASLLQRDEERLATEKRLQIDNQQLQMRSKQLEKEVELLERQLGKIQNHAYTLAEPPRTQLSPDEAKSFSRTVKKLKRHNAQMYKHANVLQPPMSAMSTTDESDDNIFDTNF